MATGRKVRFEKEYFSKNETKKCEGETRSVITTTKVDE